MPRRTIKPSAPGYNEPMSNLENKPFHYYTRSCGHPRGLHPGDPCLRCKEIARIAALEAENARLRAIISKMLDGWPNWHAICKSDESKRCPTCRVRAEAEAALTPASAARQEGRP